MIGLSHAPTFTRAARYAASAILLPLTLVAAAEDTAGVRSWTPTTATADLKAGGHVILLQHAAADEGATAVDCNAPDVLNVEERQLVARIAAGLRRLEIPVARIVASERCAALKTAELLDVGDVESDPDLNPVDEGTNDADQIARLKRMIGMTPPADSNLLLVSHRSSISRILNLSSQTVPGTLFSFRRIDGSLSLVGSVKPEEWGASDTD